MNNIVSQRKLSVHKEHELLLKLETAGLNDELAQRIIDSNGNDLATKVVRLIQNRGFEPTTSQKRAREIMGRNMFGVEEAIKHFGVNPSKSQFTTLSEIPFTEATLGELRDTYILVAKFPLSILEIYAKVGYKLFVFGHSSNNTESFVKEIGEVSWQLIRKTPVLNSFSKNWQEQQALIAKDDEVLPSAQTMTYAIFGYYVATGERLFEKVYVRTSSVDFYNHHVGVGMFDSYGPRIDLCWSDIPRDEVGLASARRQSA